MTKGVEQSHPYGKPTLLAMTRIQVVNSTVKLLRQNTNTGCVSEKLVSNWCIVLEEGNASGCFEVFFESLSTWSLLGLSPHSSRTRPYTKNLILTLSNLRLCCLAFEMLHRHSNALWIKFYIFLASVLCVLSSSFSVTKNRNRLNGTETFHKL